MALNLSGTLGSLVTFFKNSGLTGTALTTAVQTWVQNSPQTAIQGYCNTIVQNAGNPTVVKDMATKIAEVANCPAGVMAVLPGLVNATDPTHVLAAVQAIEMAAGITSLGSSGGSGFLGF